MELRLGGASSNGAPGNRVGGVLRRDCVEELGAGGHADLVEVN